MGARAFSGPLTLHLAPAVLSMTEAELAEALRTSPGARAVIIDLSGLTQVDTAALTVLLSLTRQGRKRGVVLRWKGMPAALLELAKLSSVDYLLTST